MRLVLLALVVSACGGGGRCENPPCQLPQAACDSHEDCFESEFCDFDNNSCGLTAGDIGHCVRRPTGCTGQIDFTCGCDGQTYSNPCVAEAAGVDVSIAGDCAAPPNAFGCGSRFCDRTAQICVETKFGPNPTDFGCESFPTQCRSNRTCSCIDPGGFRDCRETDGGFTVTQEVVADPAEDATSSVAARSSSTTTSR